MSHRSAWAAAWDRCCGGGWGTVGERNRGDFPLGTFLIKLMHAGRVRRRRRLSPLGLMRGKGSRAMANTDTEQLTLLAKLVIAAGIALVVAGAVSHPVTIAAVDRIWHQELARASASHLDLLSLVGRCRKCMARITARICSLGRMER